MLRYKQYLAKIINVGVAEVTLTTPDHILFALIE